MLKIRLALGTSVRKTIAAPCMVFSSLQGDAQHACIALAPWLTACIDLLFRVISAVRSGERTRRSKPDKSAWTKRTCLLPIKRDETFVVSIVYGV